MARLTGQMVVVYNGIPSLMAYVEANARTAVRRTADEIVRDARSRAPVDTGQLRSSIKAVSLEHGKSAEVMADTDYAAFVEFGTYKMAAQPFLTPAVQAHTDEFIEDVGRGFVRWGG